MGVDGISRRGEDFQTERLPSYNSKLAMIVDYINDSEKLKTIFIQIIAYVCRCAKLGVTR